MPSARDFSFAIITQHETTTASKGSSHVTAGETAERIISMELHYFFALNCARIFARRFGTWFVAILNFFIFAFE
jgi:hypothetical protein